MSRRRVARTAICGPRAWSGVLVFAASLAGSGARAEGPKRDAAIAQALFAEGRRLMAAQDYTAACAKFADSERLDPAPGTALNLAACQEKAGKLASAWADYQTAAAMAKDAGQPERAAAATRRAVALGAKLSHLTLQVPAATRVARLVVRIDDETVGASELGMPLPIDGGEHSIEASAPGYASWSTRVTLNESGQSLTVDVPVLKGESLPGGGEVNGPAAAPAAPPAAPPPPPPAAAAPRSEAARVEERPRRSSALRTTGAVLAVTGLAGLAEGAVAGILAASTYARAKSDCGGGTLCAPGSDGPSLRNSSLDWAAASTVGLIAGGVLFATGGVLFLVAPRGEAPTLGLAPSPLGEGLSLVGRF